MLWALRRTSASTVFLSLLIPVVTSVGCGNGRSPKHPQQPSASLEAQSVSEISWLHNNYAAALQQARNEGVPLVIDLWADWCHTCLAMKHGVLRDPALFVHANDFVWLAVDTEDPSSAEVMEQFPIKAWPTFYVVDATDLSVLALQVGSASVHAFGDFLQRGAAAFAAKNGTRTQGPKDEALVYLHRADKANAANDYEQAAVDYERAIAIGGSDWNFRVKAIVLRTSVLSSIDPLACAAYATEVWEDVMADHSVTNVDFLAGATRCADSLPATKRSAFYEKAHRALVKLLSRQDAKLSIDDRSDALALARNFALTTDKPDKARQYAITQQTLLNRAVAEAASAREEMTYLWHQVEVHVFLRQGAEILPWVTSLTERLPEEYDPWYRQGWLLLQLGRHGEALAAAQNALPLCHGARRGRILTLIADIHKAAGNTPKERATRQAVLNHYKALPVGQRNQLAIDAAQEALDSMIE